MGDQSDREKGETGASAIESSDLTRRLLQRSAGKVGVVDARHPQQLYARTAGWIAERFPLIGQLSARYAAEDRTPVSTRELVMGRPLMEQVNVFTAAEPHLMPGPSLPRAETTAPRSRGDSHASPSSPQGKFRISRRRPQVDLKPDQAASRSGTPSDALAKPEGDARAGDPLENEVHLRTIVAPSAPASLILAKRTSEREGETTPVVSERAVADSSNRVAAPQVSRPAETATHLPAADLRETEGDPTAIVASTAPASLVLAKRTGERARETSPRVSERVVVDFNNVGSAPAISDATEAPTTAVRIDSGAPILVQQGPREASSGPTIGPGASTLAASQAAKGLILRKASIPKSGVSDPESAASALRDHANRAIADSDPATQLGKTSQSVVAPPRPLAMTQAATSLIQRKAQTDRSNGKETSNELAAGGSQGAVVVKEIADYVSRPSRPNIIWRKTADGSEVGGPLMNGDSRTHLARQSADSVSSETGFSQSIQTVTPAPTPTEARGRDSGIDPERITERIIRAISRRLEVERERRGLGK